MTNRKNYPRLRNGKLEGGALPSNHIFIEEKKEIWVLCESSISAMGIGAVIRDYYPQYTCCLCNRKTYENLQAEVNQK